MKKIIDKIISAWSYIAIIAGLLLGEKAATNATWWNIIKSEYWEIILVIVIGMIASAIIKYYKSNK